MKSNIIIVVVGPGNLKEWRLILYGTSHNPYHPSSGLHSHSTMLDIQAPEEILEEPEMEVEEEDEYDGERITRLHIN